MGDEAGRALRAVTFDCWGTLLFERDPGGALETAPAAALHVGDLRRTEIAGARRLGMRTVRIRDHYDDPGEHPDADHVADSHAHLRELLVGLARGPGA